MSNELLDVYDEDGNFVEALPRSVVHEQGLWHRTTHCWLIKKPNSMLFQMRSNNLKDNPGKLYTTASGHVGAGEELKDALKREVEEELGAVLDTHNAELIHEGKYRADFTTTDGKEFHDRALFHVFLLDTNKELHEFDFQEEELEGLFALPAKETLELIKNETGTVIAKGVIKENGEIKEIEKKFSINDFLVLNHETAYEKFGFNLEKAIELLEK